MGGNKSKPVAEVARVWSNRSKNVVSKYAQEPLHQITAGQEAQAVGNIDQSSEVAATHPLANSATIQGNIEPAPAVAEVPPAQLDNETHAPRSNPLDEKLSEDMVKFINKNYNFQAKYDDPAVRKKLFKATAAYMRIEEEKLYDYTTGSPSFAGKLNNSQLIDFMTQYANDPTEATIKRLSGEYQIELATCRHIVRWVRMPIFATDFDGDTYAY